MSFGQVRKGQGSLALGICIGGLLITAAITWALIHSLHLDNVWADRLMACHLYFRTTPFTDRPLKSASTSALLCILHLLQGWDCWGDAELWDVVRGDDVRTKGNPFNLVSLFSKHNVGNFEVEFC